MSEKKAPEGLNELLEQLKKFGKVVHLDLNDEAKKDYERLGELCGAWEASKMLLGDRMPTSANVTVATLIAHFSATAYNAFIAIYDDEPNELKECKEILTRLFKQLNEIIDVAEKTITTEREKEKNGTDN